MVSAGKRPERGGRAARWQQGYMRCWGVPCICCGCVRYASAMTGRATHNDASLGCARSRAHGRRSHKGAPSTGSPTCTFRRAGPSRPTCSRSQRNAVAKTRRVRHPYRPSDACGGGGGGYGLKGRESANGSSQRRACGGQGNGAGSIGRAATWHLRRFAPDGAYCEAIRLRARIHAGRT